MKHGLHNKSIDGEKREDEGKYKTMPPLMAELYSLRAPNCAPWVFTAHGGEAHAFSHPKKQLLKISVSSDFQTMGHCTLGCLEILVLRGATQRQHC